MRLRPRSLARDVALALVLAAAILGAGAGLVLRAGPTLVALAAMAAGLFWARAPLIIEEAWWRARMRHRFYELDGCRWLSVADADECGRLWRSKVRWTWWEEPLTFVEVQNHSPEPDGLYRTFVIRVPPAMKSAREAVAWTFGLTDYEFRPEEES